jgi:cytochrome c-type biogenesis protein
MSTFLLALLAGILTIAAPCILPMLPIILGTSIGQTSRARPAFIALGFTVTFSACALIFGLFSESLGLSQQALRDTATGLLFLFGILMVWKRPFDWLMLHMSGVINLAHDAGNRTRPGNFGGFVLGMTLGVVWTPCAGPVLGAILTLVATERDLGRAAALLLTYSAGAGIPMLVIAYGGQHLSTKVRALVPYAQRLQKFFGVLIVLTAIAMYFQYDAQITLWLSNLVSPGPAFK